MIRYFARLGYWRGGLIAIALSLSVLVYAVGVGSEPSATVGAQTLMAQIEANNAPLILDVRSPAEFAGGHIPGAVNLPYRALPEGMATLSMQPGQAVVVYCERGVRAAIAENSLKAAGIDNIVHLSGDMVGWRKSGLPIEIPEAVPTEP